MNLPHPEHSVQIREGAGLARSKHPYTEHVERKERSSMFLFAECAVLADQLATEGSRLKKRAAIAEVIGRAAAIAPAQARRFCLYLAGQPFAEADARKLNAGGAILSRALKEVSGANDAALTAAYRRHGDLGAGAFDLLTPPLGRAPVQPILTLDDVHAAFDAMAGARSTAARFDVVEELLRRATAVEAKYLLKLMLGDMRIGVKQALVEEAIAIASGTELAAVRNAVMLEANLSRAVERAFAGTLSDARMTLFHPLGFMLASPVETPAEAVARLTPKPPKVPQPEGRRSRKKGRSGSEAASSGEVDAPEASDAFSDLDPASAVPAILAAEEGLAEDVELTAESASPEPASGAGIRALVEDKFDGMRAQLHCGDPAQPGRVALYSRNREDVTESFPELEEAFRNVAPASVENGPGAMILDGEILGWDLRSGQALPFAILGQRIGRKRVGNDVRKQIPVVFVAFDILYLDGDLLLSQPLSERRARLETLAAHLLPRTVSPLERDEALESHRAGQQPGLLFDTGEASRSEPNPVQRLLLSPVHLADSAEAIDQAYRDARARANEGVMLKAAGSPYLAGRRGLAWLKLKRELATLDVVITGAEFGSGRKSPFLSDYTFAVRGPRGSNGEPGDLLNVGKAYSGVTDVEIAELTEWLKAHTLEDLGHFRSVEPLRVIEVAFNNIMRSDRHASGFALRFPRILRLRDDKPVEEIDTLDRVEEIYHSQPDRPQEAPSTEEDV